MGLIMTKDIFDSPFLFKSWCSKLRPVWSLDTETTSLKYLDLEIIGFSICDGKQACYVVCNTKYKQELLDILEFYICEAKMIVMHNSPFDIAVLRKEGVEI